LSTGLTDSPFGDVKPVFVVGSNLITGGVVSLSSLIVRLVRMEGVETLYVDVEEIIAGSS
jgi:hypothetical protein